MISVANKLIMLSVIILNVVMVNVILQSVIALTALISFRTLVSRNANVTRCQTINLNFW
jgi:hypothetical protein